jgi:hypothetical protein
MANTYEAIATVTVGSGGAANIEFTSIPGTYTDLVIMTSMRGTDTSFQGWNLYFNGSNTNLTNRYLLGDGSSASSGNFSAGYGGTVAGTNATASTFENSTVYIPNYTSSNNKSYSSDNVAENNATLAYVNLIAGLWSSSSAITSVTLYPQVGNFAQYSTATLYGIKNS